MRLYHQPRSFNSRRVVMTAVHLGVPLELTPVNLAQGEQRRPEFLRVNPAGKVPVLVDGDFCLPESHAIMQYLAEKTPGQTLYPTEIRARAAVNRWLFWSSHHFSPAVSVLGFEYMVKALLGLGAPDPAEIKRGEMLVTETARVLDAHLAGREWMSGSGLTLADLSIAAPLMMTEVAKLPVAQLENLQAWFARVQALDAWKRTNPSPGP